MNAFEFMAGSPWLAFFIAVLATSIVRFPLVIVKRWIRHLDIKAHGWPPVHCNADGDAVVDDKEEQVISGIPDGSGSKNCEQSPKSSKPKVQR